VKEILATGPEAGGAIRHNTLALCSTDLTAKVRLTRLAELALAAFGRAMIELSARKRESSQRTKNILESDDVVADLDGGHSLANGLDDTGTLVTENDGESTLGVLAGERVGI
jgi:hypothetical protein